MDEDDNMMNKEELAQAEFNRSRLTSGLLKYKKNPKFSFEDKKSIKNNFLDSEEEQKEDNFENDRLKKKEELKVESIHKNLNVDAGSIPSRPSVSPDVHKATTISKKTMDQYLNRGISLHKRYKRETREPFDVETNPVNFVTWLLSMKPTLKSTTWRVYRQSSYYFVEGSPSENREEALLMLDNDIIDVSRTPQPTHKEKNLARRTSSSREKRFTLEDWNTIMTYLTNFSRSQLAPILKDWLRAGLYTGLRPNEWKMARIEHYDNNKIKKTYLYVLSCKSSNDRTTGAVRTLDITDFNDMEYSTVKRMVELGNHWQEMGIYSKMQGQCSNLMYKITQNIWPRRKYSYSLYSARHQFIANLKTCMRPDEIAAIVGHGSTATAESHYGKRRSGWSDKNIPTIPSPVPEELSVVRDQMKHYYDRIKLEVKAGIRNKKNVPDFPV